MKTIPFVILAIAAFGISCPRTCPASEADATCLVASHVAGRIQSFLPGDPAVRDRLFGFLGRDEKPAHTP